MKVMTFFSLLFCAVTILANSYSESEICPIIKGKIRISDDNNHSTGLPPIENDGRFLQIRLFYIDKNENRINCSGTFKVTNDWEFIASIRAGCNKAELLKTKIYLELEFEHSYCLPSGWEIIKPFPSIILELNRKEYQVTDPFIRIKTQITPENREKNFILGKKIFKVSVKNSLIYFVEHSKGRDLQYSLLAANFLKENFEEELIYELLKDKDLESEAIDKKIQLELLLYRAYAAGSINRFREAFRNISIAEKISPIEIIYKRRILAANEYIKRMLDYHTIKSEYPRLLEMPMPRKKKAYGGLSLIAKGGPLFTQNNFSTHLFTQVGIAFYNLNLSVGGALKLNGDKQKKSFFLADLLINFNIDNLYFGCGLGFHSKIKNDWKPGADIVLNAGFNVLHNYYSTGSIYAEIRTSFGKAYPLFKRNMFILGFRISR